MHTNLLISFQKHKIQPKNFHVGIIYIKLDDKHAKSVGLASSSLSRGQNLSKGNIFNYVVLNSTAIEFLTFILGGLVTLHETLKAPYYPMLNEV